MNAGPTSSSVLVKGTLVERDRSRDVCLLGDNAPGGFHSSLEGSCDLESFRSLQEADLDQAWLVG